VNPLSLTCAVFDGAQSIRSGHQAEDNSAGIMPESWYEASIFRNCLA
jgi:hypothetical protein